MPEADPSVGGFKKTLTRRSHASGFKLLSFTSTAVVEPEGFADS
jgi:hypothetical protein